MRKIINVFAKDITVDFNREKSIPYAWICKFNIIKLLVLPYFIYKFKAMPIKIPSSLYSWSQEDGL